MNGKGCGVQRRDSNEVADTWLKGLTRQKQSSSHPILPREGSKNYLITSALPYVNNVPHLGNIIGSVLSGDCFARYCRLRGYTTLYICGTDEYGTATETKAMQEGLTPQQICDKYYKIHSDVYKWFNISFDFFGRTSTPKQTEIAQDIFCKLRSNGYVLEDTMQQPFCTSCRRFLADRFVEGTCPHCRFIDARGDQCDKCGKLINSVDLIDPRCKICSSCPEVRSSKHLYVDLTKLTPKLEEFIGRSQSSGVWSSNAEAITRSWLREGLTQRCITRDLKWGTPVPLEEYSDKVFYVWFDAPIGYISITANYTDEWKSWWMNPAQVTLVNFMAKDNVPFHTVVFPSCLLGTGDDYTLLNSISSTEYLDYEGSKFSKSRGIGIFGDNAVDSGIGADVFRLYLLGNRPETQDTSFAWEDLIARNNNEYINNLGNFINRSMTLLFKSFGGELQDTVLTDVEVGTISSINDCLRSYVSCMEDRRLKDGVHHLLQVSRIGNSYVQSTQPWTLDSSCPSQKERLGSILSFSVNIVALLALLLHPFAPSLSENVMRQTGLPEANRVISDEFVQLLPRFCRIEKPSLMLSKIDPKLSDELRKKYSGAKDDRNPQAEDLARKTSDMSIRGPATPPADNIADVTNNRK